MLLLGTEAPEPAQWTPHWTGSSRVLIGKMDLKLKSTEPELGEVVRVYSEMVYETGAQFSSPRVSKTEGAARTAETKTAERMVVKRIVIVLLLK
jgi:hypothetical protein